MKDKIDYKANFLRALILRDEDTRNRQPDNKPQTLTYDETMKAQVPQVYDTPRTNRSSANMIKSTSIAIESDTDFASDIAQILRQAGFINVSKANPNNLFLKDERLTIMSSSSVDKYASVCML